MRAGFFSVFLSTFFGSALVSSSAQAITLGLGTDYTYQTGDLTIDDARQSFGLNDAQILDFLSYGIGLPDGTIISNSDATKMVSEGLPLPGNGYIISIDSELIDAVNTGGAALIGHYGTVVGNHLNFQETRVDFDGGEFDSLNGSQFPSTRIIDKSIIKVDSAGMTVTSLIGDSSTFLKKLGSGSLTVGTSAGNALSFSGNEYIYFDDVGAPIGCSGDTNGDGKVDFTDLITLARSYGKPVTGDGLAQGNFSGSGTVGFPDLLLLARNYGKICKVI